jgi:hypothetical protein
VQKRTRFFAKLFTPFFLVSTNSLFSWNLYFRISNPLCFIRLGEPLASNPRLLRFCTLYANDFANTANPVSIPVFLFLNGQWRGGGGVEGSTVEGYMLCLTKNSHHQSPAQTLYFLTYYTATKNSFTLPEITIGQEKIHGWSAHSALGPCWYPQRDNSCILQLLWKHKQGPCSSPPYW